MDLVERYLAAIGRELPETQRDDILAELRDVLLSQVEEREAELGRPMTRDEMEATLKGFGHPLTVAFRYRRFQRLIGPEVFPFYLKALRVCAMLVVGLHIVLMAVRLVRGDGFGDAISGLLDGIFLGLIWMVGAVTLAFALIDHTEGAKAFSRWRPRDLPPPYVKRSKGAFEIAFDSAFEVIFLAWWVGAFRFADITPGPTELPLRLSPAFEPFYWPVLAVSVASLAVNLLLAARPGRTYTVAAEFAVAAVTVVLALMLLGAGPWVVANAQASSSVELAVLARVVNAVVFWTLVGVAVGHAIEAIGAGSRLIGKPIRLFRRSPAL